MTDDIQTVFGVLIGPEARKYRVSRGLFAAQSPFFRDAMPGEAIYFPLENPPAFEMLLQWVYQGTICSFPTIQSLFGASVYDGYSGELTNHIELYELASKTGMRDLQNAVIDHITVLLEPVPNHEAFEVIGRDMSVVSVLNFEPNSPACFMMKAITEIYQKTERGSMLRRMIRDVTAHFWQSGKVHGFEDYYHCFSSAPGFMRDLREAMVGRNALFNPLAKRPSPYYL